MSSPQSHEPTSDEPAGPAADALRPLDLARHSGVSVETLRYYERLGLLDEPRRSPGGHRRYPPEALERMQLIKSIRRLGYGLPEVADLFAAAQVSTSGERDNTRTEVAIQDVESRIAALETIRAALTPDLDPAHTSSGQRDRIPLLALLQGGRK